MKVKVIIKRRTDLADPQGLTVARALRDLGYEDVADVRVDKTITIELADGEPDTMRDRVNEMCEKLLANPTMEDYEVVISE